MQLNTRVVHLLGLVNEWKTLRFKHSVMNLQRKAILLPLTFYYFIYPVSLLKRTMTGTED